MNSNDWDKRLLESAKNGDLDSVKECLDNVADINATNKRDETALMIASKEGHFDIVEYLVENYGNIDNRVDFGNETPLIFASQNNHLEIVEFLISKCADMNVQDYSGFTALMWASVMGYFDIVKILVENGASVNLTNRDGWSALEMSKNDEIWEYLKPKTANLNKNHALINFANHGNLEKVKYFLEQGANKNAITSKGYTALMFASKYGHLEVVKFLVENRANVNIKNNFGKIALDYAKTDEIKQILSARIK